MSEEEKEPYKTKANDDTMRYREAMTVWKDGGAGVCVEVLRPYFRRAVPLTGSPMARSQPFSVTAKRVKKIPNCRGLLKRESLGRAARLKPDVCGLYVEWCM